MNTELENIQQQVSALQENTDLITQDIVRIMPTIVSLLSENEKKMQEFHEMRAKDQELLQQIKQFIKRENDVLSKIINDYGTLQDVARQELAVLTIKEKDIVSKIAEIPDQVIVKHHYGIDLKSTPLIIVMIALSTIISLGLGVLYEKNKQLDDRKSYEMRYRMIELELPHVTSHIDSTHSLNPKKFHNLVIKREEENKLLNSIDQKRQEIKNLNSPE